MSYRRPLPLVVLAVAATVLGLSSATASGQPPTTTPTTAPVLARGETALVRVQLPNRAAAESLINSGADVAALSVPWTAAPTSSTRCSPALRWQR